jgi:hypothetical protein
MKKVKQAEVNKLHFWPKDWFGLEVAQIGSPRRPHRRPPRARGNARTTTRVVNVAAMRLHRCRASHLRPRALRPAADEEGHQHALSFPLSTPCSLPLMLSSLPCSCPPWPATLKLVATAFPCPWPPSTQMDRRTTFLSPRRASGPPLPAPLAADAPRRRSSCRRHRGYCGRATTGYVGPSWAAQHVRAGPLVLPRHSTTAIDAHSRPEPRAGRSSTLFSDQGLCARIREKRRAFLQNLWLMWIVP